jgi:hypothetical protein
MILYLVSFSGGRSAPFLISHLPKEIRTLPETIFSALLFNYIDKKSFSFLTRSGYLLAPTLDVEILQNRIWTY